MQSVPFMILQSLLEHTVEGSVTETLLESPLYSPGRHIELP